MGAETNHASALFDYGYVLEVRGEVPRALSMWERGARHGDPNGMRHARVRVRADKAAASALYDLALRYFAMRKTISGRLVCSSAL